jgi:exo-beta-1,3-glucanase (GH17 family)
VDEYRIGPALSLFALTALAIAAAWYWLGAPVAVPPSPFAAGHKLDCVSYAPFRDGQDPLVEGTRVSASQIDADLALLSKYTDCVRTYSVDDGLDHVLASARRYRMKVLEGIGIFGNAEKNRKQIAAGIALAKQYKDVVSGVIVGNEVLLRGEMPPEDLMAIIREVKSQVSEPVSYADVWEYWLRYPQVQNAVDFVTIHILPYWEDIPIPAAQAAAHVDEIRKRVAAAIPNKEILIGEFGWPSAGRMREGARPSPSNQARAIDETLALAQREHFRVNIIEAFDQAWKRWLEGAVGGHWGIFDRATGGPKFNFVGSAVSDHRDWPIQALAGIALAALMFGCAFMAAGKQSKPWLLWGKIAVLAFLPGVLFGWTIEQIPVESFSPGGWLRSLAFAAVAAAVPIGCATACAGGRKLPSLSSLLAGGRDRGDTLSIALGVAMMALILLAVEAALGLVFDPRYRDIPFAPLCGAVLPFLALSLWTKRADGAPAMAERIAAIVLAVSAVYIVFNETVANWQALWFCGGLLGLAFTLTRVRVPDAPG